MDDLSRVAKILTASTYFSDTTSTAQAGVKVLAGLEMGFPPIAAMTGIHIVKGKVQIGAILLAAAIRQSPRYKYTFAKDESGKQRFNNNECVLVFWEKEDGQWQEIGESSFTIEDARAAGTQNLQKFARNMLFSRAISNGVRWYCPDIFLGVAPYTEGEIEEVEQQGIPMIPAEDLGLVVDVQEQTNETSESTEGADF
jgi:hypothetical protein